MRSVIVMFCMGLVFGYLVAGIEASKVSSPTQNVPAVHDVRETQTGEPSVVKETTQQLVPEALYRTVTLSRDGMRFAYRTSPDGYDIVRIGANATDTLFIDGYQMVRTADSAGQKSVASDGSQSLQVLVLKNPDNLSPRVWALQNLQYSNAGSVRGEITGERFGTENAVTYTADGLYPMEYHVVAAGKYVYVLIGSYDGDASPVREDFHQFLKTFEFIPVQ